MDDPDRPRAADVQKAAVAPFVPAADGSNYLEPVVRNIPVEIDEELLKTIAESTGGRYFRATDNTKLSEIYSEINQMEKVR
ncbi:MAG: hypothetical protein IK096_01410, partial [Lachnospiraceae bacterium]|nr:hypothetical protein [Lachnospiraceae bacterium]